MQKQIKDYRLQKTCAVVLVRINISAILVKEFTKKKMFPVVKISMKFISLESRH